MESLRDSFEIEQAEYIPHMTSGLQLDTERKWYAAYTSAHHEKRVVEQLERRSVESFLPLYDSVRRWRDRRVRLQMSLFPGYVFVRISSRDRLKVQQVPGVAHLVGFGGQLTAVPEEDIQAIRACLADPSRVQPHRYLKRGQRVRVLNGPLTGLTGIVVRQRKQTRFVISFDLLQRAVAVEIDAADLGPDGTTRG
jgi:transcription antitermination factor NusG